MNKERKGPSEPGRPRSFYDIHDNGDGTADIYMDTGSGFPDDEKADGHFRVIKGVRIREGLEEDVRRRFDDYYRSAEVIWL